MRRSWLGGLSAAALVVVCAGALPRAPLLLASRHYLRNRPLRMPVMGLNVRDVRSSWHAPRSGRRRHEGADLFAAKGTRVVSATRGLVWRVGEDPLGGNVVTVLGDGPALYYYAHLDTWAAGLKVGQRVRAGDSLGTVGNTGNARTTPAHLHFGVCRVGVMRLRPVDPVPLLQR